MPSSVWRSGETARSRPPASTSCPMPSRAPPISTNSCRDWSQRSWSRLSPFVTWIGPSCLDYSNGCLRPKTMETPKPFETSSPGGRKNTGLRRSQCQNSSAGLGTQPTRPLLSRLNSSTSRNGTQTDLTAIQPRRCTSSTPRNSTSSTSFTGISATTPMLPNRRRGTFSKRSGRKSKQRTRTGSWYSFH